uniref:Uncharacterized protein n=1 Tax=Romanomermis culicivorax TaxID=13658 RepID=A0A915IZ81_ROMCU
MYPNAPSPIHWIMKTDPGYDCHLVSAFSEWILIILTATFMLTYSNDFEKLRAFVAVEPLVNHLDDAIAPQPPIDNARLLLKKQDAIVSHLLWNSRRGENQKLSVL